MACALTMSSCDDQVMEWGRPDYQGEISSSDIPLNLKEKIGNYDYIKTYAAQYTPNLKVGLGLGADKYLSDAQYSAVADANFQMYTTGNAMKHSSVVKNNGDLNFTTIDAFLAKVPQDVQIYGHNFLWHTQQKQAYLKTLIAPEVKIETSSDDVCENVVTNYGFEDGTSGWTGLWGKYTYEVVQPGHDSDNAIHFTISDECVNNYDAQLFWPISPFLEVGVTYAYSFWAKSDSGLAVQFMGQNADYGGIYKDIFTPGSDWTLCQGEFTYSEGDAVDIERVGIMFGGEPGSQLWVDDFKFGKKIEGPTNYVTNGSFEDGVNEWTISNVSGGIESVALDDAINGKNVLKMVASADVVNAWDLQVTSAALPTLPGKKVQLSFYVKSDQEGQGRVSFSSDLSNQWPWMNWTGSQDGWSEAFKTSTTWTQINVVLQNFNTDFVEGASTWTFNLDFGYLPGVTYYIDDVKVIEYVEEEAATRAATRAGGMTFIYKTAEEKKEILLGAMESWIKGIAEHVESQAPGRVVAWDVINEPISDNSKWRGIDGSFMDGDAEPVEENGLNLNWESDHWYWGYYIGKEYAPKAFEYARQYCAANTKLFVNDYNLETNPSKLTALIEFAKYIDENNATGTALVDGIGTQMHVSTSITREEVDAMFKTMAATGKLVRVTELDVRLDTSTPSAEELEAQANTYQMIFESYKANVPEAQQSGITIWTLTDAEDEHEYWLSGDAPNLFDANYARKHAYKGVCDGIAGFDISTTFNGDDWKDLYVTEEVPEEE